MATLTVTLTETVTLNGVDRGVTNTLTAAVTEVDNRILNVTATLVDFVRFGSTNGAGQYKDSDMKYLRVTNLDATATLTLRLRGDNQTSYIKIEPKGTYQITSQKMDAYNDSTSPETLVDMNSIGIKSSSAGTQAEIFVALT